MKRVLLVTLVLLGCQQPSILKGSGVKTDAPYGYTYGCVTNPDAVDCKGDK